jgi:CNT family concentrative nucleoside transporter
MPLNLISLLGLAFLIFCAWLCSLNRRAFPWRTVLWGLGLQFAFALLMLKTPFGTGAFHFAQRGVDLLNGFAMKGAEMVFGPLANRALLTEKWGAGSAFILAINISATIIVVSALSSLL